MAEPLTLPPELVARYTPLAVLGRGAMGVVLRARQRELRREVAIKLLLDPGHDGLRTRFQREARSLAAVSHPNVLQVYEYGIGADGCPFLVTEFVEGVSLDSADARLPDPLGVMLQVADALDAVHEAGLVHRDVKPANVLLTRDGRAVLADFGLVHDPDRTRLTATGHFVGTLSYLAPEVLLGKRGGAEADWYAWGLTLYRLVAGRHAFTNEQLLAMIGGGAVAGVFPALPPLPDPAAQARLGPLLAATIDPEPAMRPRSRAEVDRLLEGLALERPEGAAPAAAPHRVGPGGASASGVAPAVTSGESRSPVPPPPAGGRGRSVALGLAAVGLAGLLLGILRPSGEVPPAPEASGVAPPIASAAALGAGSAPDPCPAAARHLEAALDQLARVHPRRALALESSPYLEELDPGTGDHVAAVAAGIEAGREFFDDFRPALVALRGWMEASRGHRTDEASGAHGMADRALLRRGLREVVVHPLQDLSMAVAAAEAQGIRGMRELSLDAVSGLDELQQLQAQSRWLREEVEGFLEAASPAEGASVVGAALALQVSRSRDDATSSLSLVQPLEVLGRTVVTDEVVFLAERILDALAFSVGRHSLPFAVRRRALVGVDEVLRGTPGIPTPARRALGGRLLAEGVRLHLLQARGADPPPPDDLLERRVEELEASLRASGEEPGPAARRFALSVSRRSGPSYVSLPVPRVEAIRSRLEALGASSGPRGRGQGGPGP